MLFFGFFHSILLKKTLYQKHRFWINQMQKVIKSLDLNHLHITYWLNWNLASIMFQFNSISFTLMELRRYMNAKYISTCEMLQRSFILDFALGIQIQNSTVCMSQSVKWGRSQNKTERKSLLKDKCIDFNNADITKTK